MAALTPMALAAWSAFFGSSSKYEQLLESFAWGRWEDVLKRVDGLAGDIDEMELAGRAAVALAGLGRVEEGKQKLSRFSHGKKHPRWLYLARLAEVYEQAQLYDDAIQCFAESHQLEPENPTATLDYAMALARHQRDSATVRELIDTAEGQHLSDILAMVLPFIRGLWKLNVGALDAARDFETAMRQLQPIAPASPLVSMIIDFSRAYLAIALAETDPDKALREARLILPRLRALQTRYLWERLHRALPQLASQ